MNSAYCKLFAGRCRIGIVPCVFVINTRSSSASMQRLLSGLPPWLSYDALNGHSSLFDEVHTRPQKFVLHTVRPISIDTKLDVATKFIRRAVDIHGGGGGARNCAPGGTAVLLGVDTNVKYSVLLVFVEEGRPSPHEMWPKTQEDILGNVNSKNWSITFFRTFSSREAEEAAISFPPARTV